MATDLIRSMQTPSLAMMLGRSRAESQQEHDAFSRVLPHEHWLAGAAGLDVEGTNNSPPIALRSMVRLASATAPVDGTWFVLNPVHLHVARDHLVLTDPRRLNLTDAESRQLCALAEPVFAEYGHALIYGDATTWFMRADDWHDLRTSTPDAACGHNIDIWMPTGSDERAWRKLQNEIQMHWHDASVNDERQSAGKKPVNSLWLWGAAQAPQIALIAKYPSVFMPSGAMQFFGICASDELTFNNASSIIAASTDKTLLVLDSLIEPAIGEDLGEWLVRINQLEADWFVPILHAIKSGAIDQCRFVLTDATQLRERTIGRTALRKFWQAPSLSVLLA